MQLQKASSGDEAGLTVYMSETSHYDLFVKQLSDKKQALILRYRLGELSHIEKEIVLPKGDVQIRVKGNRDFYSFEYATNGKTFHELGRMNSRYLSSETAGGFTGIMLSINPSSKGYAEFEYFDYSGK